MVKKTKSLPPIITAEDWDLWKRVNRETLAYRPEEDPFLAISAPEKMSQTAPLSPIEIAIKEKQVIAANKKQFPSHLSCGDIHAMNTRTAMRFKRGQMKIDKIIDLHGLGIIAAFEEVCGAISGASSRHQRTLLFITGKGRGGEGVLRKAFPHWMNDLAIRTKILAFDTAPLKDGGGGAFMVLLKRNKNDD